MKNRLTNRIDLDLEAFLLYCHKPTDTLIAVEMEERDRIEMLIKEYGGIETIPNEETVDGFQLHYNAEKNAYEIQVEVKINFIINELEYTWVNITFNDFLK